MFGDESASAREFVLTLFLCSSIISVACRTHTSSGGSVEAKISAAGEPDRYSAVVVRSVEDGASTVTSTSSEARFGEKRRVEWTEDGNPSPLVTPAADLSVQEVDRYFDDDQPPERSEVRTLSSVVIDGHKCDVSEFSSTFSDGRTEIVTRSKAQDL